MGAIAALATAGALVLGCGVPIESSPNAIAPDQLPSGLRPSDTTVPATPTDQEPIDVWFVRDDRLSTSRHRIDPPITPQATLDELLSGPSQAEQNRSLRSAIPDSAAVLAVDVIGGLATVALAPEFSEIPASDQVLAVGQIVLTLTDLRGVGRVRFAVDDEPIAVPLPTGDASLDSVSRDDYIVMADTSL